MMKNQRASIFFQYFEEIVAASLFCVTLLSVCINVFARYVLKTGIPWSEEVATGCFVWTSFIGAAACYKRHAHVGVDILVNRLPSTLRNIVKICTDIILIILNSYLFYLSVIYVMNSYTKPTPLLGISSAYISISLVFAFFDMAVWSFIFIYQDIKAIKAPTAQAR